LRFGTIRVPMYRRRRCIETSEFSELAGLPVHNFRTHLARVIARVIAQSSPTPESRWTMLQDRLPSMANGRWAHTLCHVGHAVAGMSRRFATQ